MRSSSTIRRSSPHIASSGDSNASSSRVQNGQSSLTPSRSPASGLLNMKSANKGHRHMSPSISRAFRQKVLLPAQVEFRARLPFASCTWILCVETRLLAENILILGSMMYAASLLTSHPPTQRLHPAIASLLTWAATEIHALCTLSLFYMVLSHSTLSRLDPTCRSIPSSGSFLSRTSTRSVSPRLDSKRTHVIATPSKADFGFIWMSVPKNYRPSSDDGVFTGLLFGPIIACSLLVSSLGLAAKSKPALPAAWLIEHPIEVPGQTAIQALTLSRLSLVDLSTFCSSILLLHICSSWLLENQVRKSSHAPEGERPSVPRSEALRSWYYVLFTLAVSLAAWITKLGLEKLDFGIWQNLNPVEIIVASLFYQFALYVAIRLAHRSFTLGELGLVCFGGTALFMEFLNITSYKIWPITTPYIKTYRLLTPLLIFQMALVAGSLLTGFILSPFLVLSRHIAQRPVRRLKHPEEKLRRRRFLALGFYVGAVLMIGGFIGLWTRWCLNNRDPWLWAVLWLLEGEKKWTRGALLLYWGLLGCLSVAGWSRQLVRSRKYRARLAASEAVTTLGTVETQPSGESSPQLSSSISGQGTHPLGLSFTNLPNLPNGSNVSNVAADLLDAADKHVPTLNLNARRKFFHALAVVMFIPGIAIDPAFTNLSFSAAFALFTFAEYIRYFAVYPFGASVHLFMNEFLDHRDGGTAILSHFYLLTGCAGAVWLEGPTQLLQYTGTLALGVGDALASVVGKRLGTHRWSATTPKTIEGSLAFITSVVCSALLLRICGYSETFSVLDYTMVSVVSSILEALSDQNDNLTLPLYMWSMLILCSVYAGWGQQLKMPFTSNGSASFIPQFHPISIGTSATLMDSPHNFDSKGFPRRLNKIVPASPQEKDTSPRFSLTPAVDSTPAPDVSNNLVPGNCSGDSSSLTLQTQSKGVDDQQGRSGQGSRPTAPSSAVDPIGQPEREGPEHDWTNFINSYSSGQWDPNRIPNLPRSSWSSKLNPLLSETSRPSESPLSLSMENNGLSDSPVDASERASASTLPVPSLDPKQFTLSSSVPDLTRPIRPAVPTHINIHPHRLRSSFSSRYSTGFISNDPDSGSLASSELQTTVATMRWAAARVDISPLALPSPEHELTDPMRGVTATIPGSRPEDAYELYHDTVTTPGGTRRPRLASFWEGTQDVDGVPYEPRHQHGKTSLPPHATHQPFPSSMSTTRHPATTVEDYFTSRTSSPDSRDAELSSSPPSDAGLVSTIAVPRRMGLTRQASLPLPSLPGHDNYGDRLISDSSSPSRVSRPSKEEQMFVDSGFLAPPNPPDELERRRALYKFNIWNTGPDTNFDRIAHLAQLVFNTKGVVISLVDGSEQWFKSEWGMQSATCSRIHSFCAHSILQRGDEPMVVLDAQLDWRFAKNPLVTGHPHIRFYAGAPLRTQDGFNIGTLAVMDLAPREEFLPRQRHTLKEFAAIVMREMELWRDKIQLRIRDRIQNSMEQFSRECLEIDSEAQIHHRADRPDLIVGASMDKVYDRAAKLVQRTLDVEGVIVMDVSHCEVLETMNTEGSVAIVMHHGDPRIETTTRQLSSEEYHELNAFFAKHPDGKISEGILPPCFRPFLPTHIQYALTVPIFNIDKRPFALLCAYNSSDHTKRFLEGHELSYLRAIGVIILSAVLKRRMILADKAKSLFISNISHELRTPLHGILAAAELLRDTQMSHSQLSFLQTVQACGNSLVETVNHVLDFTKLSGNSKSGGVENVITPTHVDLMQLVEEAVDGCWIGHRARAASTGESAIGSVYAPPKETLSPVATTRKQHVETIVDIGFRKEGWLLKCEKGGIRRVLMNLFGNSLKFTNDGYVHVILRQLPPSRDDLPDKVKVELAVLDTGKGISQSFLKNQLFHPFSQENPLQAGTGLGLAIVNAIVQSESVGGKVDVWSEEGAGTEIKVTFTAERVEPLDPVVDTNSSHFEGLPHRPTVTLLGFDVPQKGFQLLKTVICTYLVSWWGFEIQTGPGHGDIVIVNDDPAPLIAATERRDITRPFILLSAARGGPTSMTIASDYERIGGFCRILYKPTGPIRLRAVLNLCLHALNIGNRARDPIPEDPVSNPPVDDNELRGSGSPLFRRNSEERSALQRPLMTPRSLTVHPTGTVKLLASKSEAGNSLSTVTIGSGGTLLQSSLRDLATSHRGIRVLVVEDNNILRTLLLKWLSAKGYEYRDAVDGRDGVNVYEHEGPFDVVLLDLSMPVLDGVAATAEIRRIEIARLQTDADNRPTRILALTGMSSLEDKRRAFDAGVDGYLVKPVAFKTLDEMFFRLGIV
ncbi:hypothetical protein BDN72DRAFT_876194 [Pluteus cervinus]|uniref:Uncharacterized protein n=1 Tax=Pluteus cervinus TaxID=181527 RepID=A0ACD3B4R8_9AGAR|nr:hypothetical protein BDN72DRAFT_876194 [Pluteus cervinus]